MEFNAVKVGMAVTTAAGRRGIVESVQPRLLSTRDEKYPGSRNRVFVSFSDKGAKLVKFSAGGLSPVA